MRRREFITLVGGGAAAWPLAARAQQGDRIRRVGMLLAFTENDPDMRARISAFRQPFTDLGWTDVRHVRIDYPFSRAAGAAGPGLGMTVPGPGVGDGAGIEQAIAAFAREPNGGLTALPHVVTAGHRELIARLAIEHRLPSVGAFGFMATSGGLISYGIDVVDLFRRSASYVDPILKGEKPADLPVKPPTKDDLVIHPKTAKALGLDVPTTVLARADEVIE